VLRSVGGWCFATGSPYTLTKLSVSFVRVFHCAASEIAIITHGIRRKFSEKKSKLMIQMVLLVQMMLLK
jgi:hypothetical protein